MERRQLRDRQSAPAIANGSSSSSRKVTVAVDVSLGGEEKRNAESAEKSPEADFTYLKPNIYPSSDISDIAVTNHEAARWDRLPADAQQRCCAAVTRLILFKGII